MFTKEYLENLDTPCQYIAGKKIVCTVVRSHLEALAIIAEKDKEMERLRKLAADWKCVARCAINIINLPKVKLEEDMLEERDLREELRQTISDYSKVCKLCNFINNLSNRKRTDWNEKFSEYQQKLLKDHRAMERLRKINITLMRNQDGQYAARYWKPRNNEIDEPRKIVFAEDPADAILAVKEDK